MRDKLLRMAELSENCNRLCDLCVKNPVCNKLMDNDPNKFVFVSFCSEWEEVK